MTAVVVLVVVGTAIWVGFDASGRDWSGDGFANRPWKWVLGCLGLWIIVFPMYLVRRNRTRPRVGAATVSTAGVALAATGYSTAATHRRAAGWYPDPYDEMRMRFWTGSNWSDQVAERKDNSV
jgi:hypothetical protein